MTQHIALKYVGKGKNILENIQESTVLRFQFCYWYLEVCMTSVL